LQYRPPDWARDALAGGLLFFRATARNGSEIVAITIRSDCKEHVILLTVT
jgi:hypothetical protein